MRTIALLFLLALSTIGEAQVLRSSVAGDTTAFGPSTVYGRIIFSPTTNTWWVWNGIYWRELTTGSPGSDFWKVAGATEITGNVQVNGNAHELSIGVGDRFSNASIHSSGTTQLAGDEVSLSAETQVSIAATGGVSQISFTTPGSVVSQSDITSIGSSSYTLLSAASDPKLRLNSSGVVWEYSVGDASSSDKVLLYDNSTKATKKLGIGSGLSVSGGNLVVSGSGISSLNGLTAGTQTFATGTSGTNFGVSSSTSTHTFNLPDAGSGSRGVVSTGSQTFAGAKNFTSTATITNSPNVTSLIAGEIQFDNISAGDDLTMNQNGITRSDASSPGGDSFTVLNTSGDVEVNSTVGEARLQGSTAVVEAVGSGQNASVVSGTGDVVVNAGDDLLVTADNANFSNTIAIRGGSPGSGKVLISDSDGDASWATGYSTSSSGTYTPTLANVSNVVSSTAHPCNYIVVGLVVQVGCQIEVDPSATALTTISITLPIASGGFSNSYELTGVGTSEVELSANGATGIVFANTATEIANYTFFAVNTSSRVHNVQFTYKYLVP